MSRLRLLLFWLLVLVVPLQGFAATTKLLCDSQRGAHRHATLDAFGGGHAHSHHSPASSHAATHGDADAGVTSPGIGGPAHQCGLCTACCNAVALGHEHHGVIASPAPRGDTPEVAANIPVRSTAVPEKPPRA